MVDIAFARSLDDFELTFEEPKQSEKKPVKEERQPSPKMLQTGIGSQPGEPAMLTKYEDTAEYKNNMVKQIQDAKDEYDRYMRSRRNKFYMQDLIKSERNILYQDTYDKRLKFWKDMLSEAQRLAREAYRRWMHR